MGLNKEKERIFLVNDDSSILELYIEILSFKGFKVIGSAKDGTEATQMFRNFSQKPDVNIMDHRIPINKG